MPLNLPISPAELNPQSAAGKLRDNINIVDVAPGNLATMLRTQPAMLPQFQSYLSTQQSVAGQTLQVGQALASQMSNKDVFAALGAVPGLSMAMSSAIPAVFNSPGGLANAMAQVLVSSVLGGYGVIGVFAAQQILQLKYAKGLIEFVQTNVINEIDSFLSSVTDSDGFLKGQYAKGIIAPECKRVGLQLIEIGWAGQDVLRLWEPEYSEPGSRQQVDGGQMILAPTSLGSALRYIVVSPAGSLPIPTTQLNLSFAPLMPSGSYTGFSRDNSKAIYVRDVNGVNLPPTLFPGSVYKLYPYQALQAFVEFQPGAHVPPGIVS